MDTDSYEIFRKELDNTTVIVEAVKGIDQARRRLEELNQSERAEHFIFDPIRLSVVDPLGQSVTKDPLSP